MIQDIRPRLLHIKNYKIQLLINLMSKLRAKMKYLLQTK
jgi:hypothetical protein